MARSRTINKGLCFKLMLIGAAISFTICYIILGINGSITNDTWIMLTYQQATREGCLLWHTPSEIELFLFQYLQSNIHNSSHITHGWYAYRLGDMVRWKARADDKKWGKSYHRTHYPHSIATQYLSMSKKTTQKRWRDYELLARIVRNRTNSSSYTYNNIEYDEMVIIHLRTGDIFDAPRWKVLNASIDTILNYKNESGPVNWYQKGRAYYMEQIEKLKQYKLSKALFITGWHLGTGHNIKDLGGSDHTKSILYIKAIVKIFAENGFNQISLRINRNPDEDFLVMCNAKYFIQSGGGFSDVIAHIVELNGGNVFSSGIPQNR